MCSSKFNMPARQLFGVGGGFLLHGLFRFFRSGR
jgi:hypothetical protein